MIELAPVLERVPDYREFLTLDELRAGTQVLVREFPGLARLETVGSSAEGRPIELLTIGHGRRPALLVGVPHPNEPIGTLTLDFIKETLKEKGIEIRYGVAPHRLTALERDVMDMEAQLQAARLLTWRAAWMMDQGMTNNLEASMAKAKAGLVVTLVTQKAVEILGPLGYSRDLLVEKWMRDAKINDIYEGTQQINQLIVARRILEYSSSQLR